ncbi:hypothetical protein DRE_04557 [Drechslerella stenobrocha 248]|uniref:MARVEL domain-containing protein n=1 Tax=Drechslerella stenobrocha 248 TaxID=1043628 RepID=W7HSH3_9PEZI|nr:hypothetical protein DRE_04557 [Drechslerella stenobrocha 248]
MASQGPISGAHMPQHAQYNNGNTHPGAAPDFRKMMSTKKPEYPAWLRILPLAILVLTFGVLAMIAYVVNVSGTGEQSLGFNLFACAWGILVLAYIILAIFSIPSIHYNWLILGLSVLSAIFWLTAFAYLASDTHKIFQAIDLINQYASLYSSFSSFSFATKPTVRRAAAAVAGFKLDFAEIDALIEASKAGGLVKRQSYRGDSGVSGIVERYFREFETIRRASRVMAGAAAIGAIIWVLWVVFTVFYCIALRRSSESAPADGAVASYEPKLEQGQGQLPQQPIYPAMPLPPPQQQQQQQAEYITPVQPNTVPVHENFAPVKPEAAQLDPRAQEEQFMTPPPPPSQTAPTPGSYVNPQFGGPAPAPLTQGNLQAYDTPDRGYTVSPLSEMPGSDVGTRAEMPGVRQE